MEAIRGGPSSSKKCCAVEIDWMRKFQRFGKALSSIESTLKSINVSSKSFLISSGNLLRNFSYLNSQQLETKARSG